MKTLIIIPAYNESASIERVADNIRDNYSQYDFIVINDGSRDATADICRVYSMAMTTQTHPAEHGLLDSRRGYVRKASHRAFSVYNATLAEARFVSSRKVGSVIVDSYEKDGEKMIVYYRPDDIRRGDTPPNIWKEGEQVVPREGVVVDLLTGRVYRRPDILPLHDHPYMWARHL